MELWPWKAKRKWLMMRPTEGLQDNQRLDQMWADGWRFWTLKIDVFGENDWSSFSKVSKL